MFNPNQIINTGQAYADQATNVLSKGAQAADQASRQVTQSAQQAAQQASQAVQTTAKTVEQGARDVRAQLPSQIVSDADRRTAARIAEADARAQERIEQTRVAVLYTGIALIVLGGLTYFIVKKRK